MAKRRHIFPIVGPTPTEICSSHTPLRHFNELPVKSAAFRCDGFVPSERAPSHKDKRRAERERKKNWERQQRRRSQGGIESEKLESAEKKRRQKIYRFRGQDNVWSSR